MSDNPVHSKDTAESFVLSDNVFETDRKRLELRALCFRPDQLAPSPPRCEESSYLTRTVPSSTTLDPQKGL